MHPYLVRAVRTAAILALASVAACGDKEVGSSKLKSIKVGDNREAVFKALGDGPLTAVKADIARLDHGFRHMQYFVNGHQFEIVYYREALGTVSEPVEQAVETPVVLMDEKVLGTGWAFYVEAMKKYGLPTPLVEKVKPPVPADSAKPNPADSSAMKPAPVTKQVPTADSLKKKM